MPDTLGSLEVLVFDCQATGAHAAGGHLIEIGWGRTRADEWSGGGLADLQTFLLRLPPGVDLSPRVSRMTGIAPEDLASAAQPTDVWRQLTDDLSRKRLPGSPAVWPAVIHFARFELPFLHHLHGADVPNTPFPFEMICTHAIARHLMPGLPRRGLRAVAGYLGHSVAEQRRCAPHLNATAAVWSACVTGLKRRYGVRTLDDLRQWLRTADPPTAVERIFPLPRHRRVNLPDAPGIYRMRRADHDLLYVGKASSLRQRVASYFHRSRRHPGHILEMLSQAHDVDVTVTGSALEAALLESDEIKAAAPPYNRALRNGDTRLIFCARNFGRRAGQADAERPLGPLPECPEMDMLHQLAEWMVSPCGGARQLAAAPDSPSFDWFRGRAPDPGCLAAGLDVFRHRHRQAFAGRTAAGALTGLGARFWRERLAAAKSAESSQKPPEKDAAANEDAQPDWTPELVADALEGVVCRAARMIRRARWLCLLSESTLCWKREGAGGETWRQVIISGAQVVSATACAEPGVPPGWTRSIRQRQQRLDRSAYDRLRILTTELRRLLTQERHPRICLRPGCVLGPHQLARGLVWI